MQIETIAKQFGQMRADYDAAKKTRFKRARTGMVPTGSASDYHYRTEQAYFGMVEQARELFRNHCLVAQGIRRLVANILLGGFTLDVRTGDKALDSELSARWYEWAESPDACDLQGEQDWRGIERLTLQQVVVDGDLVTLPTSDGALQQIENHRLRTPNRTKRNIVHGVELSPFRKRLAYWIAAEDAEQYYPVPKASEMARYDARGRDGQRQVFHHYMPDRSSQTRGVTAFAPVMETAGMGDDLFFAQLVKAQMAACATLLRELSDSAAIPNAIAGGQDSSTESRPDGTTRQLVGWQPGMEIFGFPGESLKLESPAVPNAEFFNHAMLILSIVAVNLDLPVAVLMLDPSKTNFSGWRGAMDQARSRFSDIQRWLISTLHTPVYLWKVRQWGADDSALQQAIDARGNQQNYSSGINAFGHVWHTAGWAYIEPVQDAAGDLIQIRNMLTSPRRASSRRGLDFQDLVGECTQDREYTIDAAQETADRLNERHASKAGWVPLTWRDIAQYAPPEGVQIATGQQQAANDGGTNGNG